MKTLILNGSPRPRGDTAALIEAVRGELRGQVTELSAYRSSIAPCVDCRGCWETARCVVQDDMELIYKDDFDCVILASPVYYGTLPGPVLSVLSRFQPQHAATFFLHAPLKLRPKRAGLILTAGGSGNARMAAHHIKIFFRMVNGQGYEKHPVYALQTDTLPAREDLRALEQARALARYLNGEEGEAL